MNFDSNPIRREKGGEYNDYILKSVKCSYGIYDSRSCDKYLSSCNRDMHSVSTRRKNNTL